MKIPSLNNERHEIIIPSTGEKLLFKPFSISDIQELKNAIKSNEDLTYYKTFIKILRKCFLNKDNIIIENWTSFDIDFVFMKIRSKSFEEKLEILFTCTDDNKTKIPIKINFDEIKVEIKEDDKIINITEDKNGNLIGVKLKYPSIKKLISYGEDKKIDDTIEGAIELIYDNLDYVFLGKEKYTEFSKKDFTEFISETTREQFEKVHNFFLNIPKIRYIDKIINPNTGVENNIILEGLDSFTNLFDINQSKSDVDRFELLKKCSEQTDKEIKSAYNESQKIYEIAKNYGLFIRVWKIKSGWFSSVWGTYYGGIILKDSDKFSFLLTALENDNQMAQHNLKKNEYTDPFSCRNIPEFDKRNSYINFFSPQCLKILIENFKNELDELLELEQQSKYEVSIKNFAKDVANGRRGSSRIDPNSFETVLKRFPNFSEFQEASISKLSEINTISRTVATELKEYIIEYYNK